MEEITAEYQATALLSPEALRVRCHTTVAAKTDLGRVRENNEDKFEFFASEDSAILATRGKIYVVCDGMGGHAAGQIASEIAAKTFIDVYLNHPATEVEVALRSAVNAANRFVHDVSRAVPSRNGMGTTLSALIVLQDRGYIAHVGDSRIYRLRNGELVQLTADHTWIEEALRKGMISEEETGTHPYRHVLLRGVGTEASVEADVFDFELKEGDEFLLCSDGLINHVADDQIEQTLKNLEPARAAWDLVGQALMNGGSDNTTVVIVRIDRLEMV